MTKLRILLSVLLCCAWVGTRAQSADVMKKAFSTPKDSLPYRLNPVLPEFNIKLLDSASIFNTNEIKKGRPVALLLFAPDCGHCQQTTEMLLSKMDSLSGIDFYFVSHVRSVTSIRNFADKYKLSNYKNIKVVGQDYDFFFLSHYGTRLLPDIALYDRHKKLLKLFESNITVKDLYEAVH